MFSDPSAQKSKRKLMRSRAKSKAQNETPRIVVGSIAIAVVLLLWWLLTSITGIVAPLYFPSPESAIDAFVALNWQLGIDAIATFRRVLLSWALGSSIGVLVGLAMSRSALLRYALAPLIEAVRPVPPIALIPFIILWFGIGDSGKVFLGSLACFMVMVINTLVAVTNVPPVYRRAGRSLGASASRINWRIVLPAILPEILAGFRIGSALAWTVIVATEFLGAEAGIGRLIMQASRTLNTPVVLVGTVAVALMAIVLDQIIVHVSARLTRWAPKEAY